MGVTRFNMEFHKWVKHNVLRKGLEENWPTKFVIIMWCTWKWRNFACLGELGYIPQDKPSFLLSRFDEIICALKIEDLLFCMKKYTSEVYVGWESPLEGWALLNMDGVSKGNLRSASVEGTLRGYRGEWLCRRYHHC